MTDREKVINDLQDAVNDDWMWQHADYYAKAIEDAIALIREQQEQLKAHEWRKFEFREPNAEEKASHPDWVWVLVNAPYEGDEILVSDGKYGWKDEFCNNGDECYLDSGHEMERCWWMPLPELPKEAQND